MYALCACVCVCVYCSNVIVEIHVLIINQLAYFVLTRMPILPIPNKLTDNINTQITTVIYNYVHMCVRLIHKSVSIKISLFSHSI